MHPSSFGNRLGIESCGIENLPRELLKMNNLEYLHVGNCPLRGHHFRNVVDGDTKTLLLEGKIQLNQLSSSNGRCMLALKTLELSRTELTEVSFDEVVCPNLQKLTLRECYELRQIGLLCGLETMTSLQALEVEHYEKLHSINLTSQVMECEKF